MPPFPKIQIGPLLLTQASREEQISAITDLATSRFPGYVCFVNAHMVSEADQSPEFAAQVNGSALACPDGAPVAWTMRWFSGGRQDRVAGMDVFPILLDRAEALGLRASFFGEEPGVLEKLSAELKESHPKLVVADMISPPFRDPTAEESEAMILQLKHGEPHLIFVALGCPKQERWMARHSAELPACLLGVGNAFRTYLGLLSRPPSFMRRMGLEWLWRLIAEPRRLWRRYFWGNFRFVRCAWKNRGKNP